MSREIPQATGAGPMLTKDILFGMNILTLAGFVVMGLTLTLNRMGPGRQGREYRPHGRRHCSGLPWAVRRGLVGIGHVSPIGVSFRPTRSHTAV